MWKTRASRDSGPLCLFALAGLLVAASAMLLLSWARDTHAQPLKVGLVYDSAAGAGDMSFNWMAYQGLLRAETDFGVVGTTYTPASDADYGPLLQQCVNDGNGLCLSVGFMMADATWDTAAANPGIDFAIVDTSWDSYPDNLRGMVFASEQVGYLAGTLAGLMTSSDVVGGVGGMEIPPVQAFLEPYRYGAGCANPDVQVLITYTGTFNDPDLGAQVAEAQMALGADVVFGAGGATGNGAILEATQAGAWAVGVDVDQWLTVFDSGAVASSDRLLTSAMKRIDNAVYDTIADEVGGAFTPGTALYDLAVDGVGLAPFHEADPAIPQSVRDALDAVKAGILDGSIDVWEPCAYFRIFLPNVVRSSPVQ
jgi:basic membrane protein A and related proteins